jgi:tape measure domain-containing protein
MNAYEFIIQMKNYASSTLQNVAASVGMTNNRVNELNGSFAGTERSAESFASKAGAGFRSLTGLVAALGISIGVIGGLTAMGRLGMELEQTNVKFEVLMGSAEKAKGMMEELNTYANSTPYSNEGIVKGAELMLAFGVAHEKVMPNIKMLGDVAMGNEEKLGGISLAYSQIMATGRLMGEDLNQLTERGFNPLKVISENTGISMGTLRDQMAKGAIGAEMVEEAFRLATSEGGQFYQMSDRMSETAAGRFSTMMGEFKQAIATVGLAFVEWIAPLFDIGAAVASQIVPFARAIADVVKWVIEAKPLLFFFGAVVAGLAVSFGIAQFQALMLTYAMGGFSFSLGIATAKQAALNFVMSMNPIGKIIIGIGALIAIVWSLWNRFEGFRGVVMGTWEVLKGFGNAIKNYVINRLQDLLSGITGIGASLKAFFSGDFSQAFEIGKKAVGDLIGIDSAKKFMEDGKAAAKEFSTGYNNGVKMKAAEVGVTNETKEKTPDYLKQKKSSVFDGLMNTNASGKKGDGKQKADGIVSGGSKLTNITINIEKLQDDTKIYVDKSEQGIESLGEKVQEMLLRAVNSVNQMQTA